MIYIDFMGGLHGHFLEYSVNSLDSTVRPNIFTEYGTSHNAYQKKLAIADHYSQYNIILPKKSSDYVISIIGVPDDCLLINLLCYSRAGDYNFDLMNFNINLWDQLKGSTFENMIDQIDVAYNTDIRLTNSVSRGILREYFKFNYKDYTCNNIINEINKQQYIDNSININFKMLHNFNTYILALEQIIEYTALPYTIDRVWYLNLWQEFISKVKPIEWNTTAHEVLDAIVNQTNLDINFNLLQESWLNARLELLYNKEMPFMQEQYFTNTHEIIEYLDL